ncbi:hypothetical protein DTO212C5_6085 [Paecilomyces variotii]|nr:hypothetical protein DTO212C5_6085 [Paecilomyces variotii]
MLPTVELGSFKSATPSNAQTAQRWPPGGYRAMSPQCSSTVSYLCLDERWRRCVRHLVLLVDQRTFTIRSW